MQNHFNLLYREEEREMLPLCPEGIGVIPWSPLARGRLTRTWDETTDAPRRTNSARRCTLEVEADRQVVDRVGEVAEKRGVPRAQIALAWVLAKPAVTAPIVGATKLCHLDDAVAALALKLTPEELEALEEPYVPHAVAGISRFLRNVPDCRRS